MNALGSMRIGYAETLIELAQSDSNVVFVTCDCGGEEYKWFRDKADGRLIEVGIAEANAASVAAGLACEGFHPFLLTFGSFAERMYNQLSESVAEDAYPVTVTAYYCGVWGIPGRSHNCIIDLAFMRALPNYTIFAPADYWEAKTVVRKAYETRSPTYIRLSGIKTPNVYNKEPDYHPTNVIVDGSDCTVFCHGTMVSEAIQSLSNDGLSCRIVNVSQIKPLPEQEIIRHAKETGSVVIAEDHSCIGGLAEAIGLLLAQNYPVPLRAVCAPDKFPLSSRIEEPNVYEKYGISSRKISAAISAVSRMR